MKARIPKHREFIIDFPQDMDQATWAMLRLSLRVPRTGSGAI